MLVSICTWGDQAGWARTLLAYKDRGLSCVVLRLVSFYLVEGVVQKVPATIDLGAAGVRRGIKYIYASRLFKKSKGVRVAPHGAVEEVERVVAHAVPICPTMA